MTEILDAREECNLLIKRARENIRRVFYTAPGPSPKRMEQASKALLSDMKELHASVDGAREHDPDFRLGETVDALYRDIYNGIWCVKPSSEHQWRAFERLLNLDRRRDFRVDAASYVHKQKHRW